MKFKSYIIEGGVRGGDRLKVLADATWPTSQSFLERAGINSRETILDLGCGNGEITLRVYEFLKGEGNLSGFDSDPKSLELAKTAADAKKYKINFEVRNLEDDLVIPKADFIYVRFLLSHLKDPRTLLKRIRGALKPGGVVAVEDVDFEGHFSHPKSHAFDTYVELYKNAAKARGVDPLIGPKLPQLLKESDFNHINMSVVLPTFMAGIGKNMGLLTLRSIRSAIIDSNLISSGDADRLEKELLEFTEDNSTIMSLPRIFQVWATN